MTPYELMLQLMCKKDDPFSGGRTYYSHPSLNREGFPKTTSIFYRNGNSYHRSYVGIKYQENEGLIKPKKGKNQ